MVKARSSVGNNDIKTFALLATLLPRELLAGCFNSNALVSSFRQSTATAAAAAVETTNATATATHWIPLHALLNISNKLINLT